MAGFGSQTMTKRDNGVSIHHRAPNESSSHRVWAKREGRAIEGPSDSAQPPRRSFCAFVWRRICLAFFIEPGKNITWSLWLRPLPTLMSPSDFFYTTVLELSTLYLINHWKGNNLHLIASYIGSPPPHCILNRLPAACFAPLSTTILP